MKTFAIKSQNTVPTTWGYKLGDGKESQKATVQVTMSD